MAKEKTNSEGDTAKELAEFAMKTWYFQQIVDVIQFLEPKLNETEVLKKCLFYFTNAIRLDELTDMFAFLSNEASDKVQECQQLAKIVGKLDLEGLE